MQVRFFRAVIHTLLVLITLVTATISGTLFPFGPVDMIPLMEVNDFEGLLNFLLLFPYFYAAWLRDLLTLLATRPALLIYGLEFSISLIFIIFCHEMGHYIACRYYRVEATLPAFIPSPPLISPAGTFGAFIKIKSHFPTRKAIFDIGVAGPIAGFIALLPVAVLGVATMQTASPEQIQQSPINFADPLLIKLIGVIFGVDLSLGIGNAFYFAAWVGLLMTALNLIPAGQLDGGHATFALFGGRLHHVIGNAAFLAMALFTILGWYFYSSPSGLIFTLILAVMTRIGHPPAMEMERLPQSRKIVALLTLLIFILSFAPIPVRINLNL
jgi:membrane-associated protease RseP (regulator of RpoE activity)